VRVCVEGVCVYVCVRERGVCVGWEYAWALHLGVQRLTQHGHRLGGGGGRKEAKCAHVRARAWHAQGGVTLNPYHHAAHWGWCCLREAFCTEGK